jgi:hypothetical protein
MPGRFRFFPQAATKASLPDHPPLSLSGLVFPKNGDAPGAVVSFRFTGADMPPIQPLTILVKVFPYAQAGFHTTFFHGRSDGNLPSGGGNFFGAHPYPQGGSAGTTHNWEVATNFGDFVTDFNGNDTTVTKDQWYRQAATAENAGTGVVDFYWNLGVSSNRLIRANPGAGYVLSNDPTAPALIFGDAPWAPLTERLGGVLRGIQVYTAKLTLPQIEQLSPLDTDAAVLAAASTLGISSSLWYLNINPRPGDITDKSGNGHDPAWSTANTATLWTS